MNYKYQVTSSKGQVRNIVIKKYSLFIFFCYLLLVTCLFVLLPACSKSPSSATQSAQPAKVLYTCPMHPKYISDKPGDCPICHMRLVPIENNPVSRVPRLGSNNARRGTRDSEPNSIEGQASITLSPDREQLIGIQLSSATSQELFRKIRAPGRVAYDPGLYSAVLEHQQSLRTLQQAKQDGREAYAEEARSTVQASRLRLRQMGLSDSQIQGIANGQFDPSTLLLGHAGENSWVYVDIFDYEAGYVKPGQKVELTSPALPGQVRIGKVRSVDSVLNSETRSLRARVDVPNPNGDLKPEMYLSATIWASLGKHLAIPITAVLNTGMRTLVFVEKEPGQYEPREVRLGQEAEDAYEILEGIREGEKVVTSANFLVDSESKIRSLTK